MLIFRKIVFYIFLLIYVILCPLVILYALGYIVKPETKEHIVETGVIYISTLPPGASVYIDKALYPSVTPTTLDKLLPGNYKIDVLLEGYKPWVDTLPVKPKAATVSDNIILIPEKWTNDIILPDTFDDIISIRGSDFFIVVKGKIIDNYLIYDYKEGKASPLIKADSPYKGATVISSFTRKKSDFFVIEVSLNTGNKFLLIEFEGETAEIEDITDLVPVRPLWFFWESNDKENMFTFHDGRVNRLDIKSRALYPDYIKNIKGFGISGRWVYAIKEDCEIVAMDYDKKNIEKILEDPKIGESLFAGGKGYYTIEPFGQNSILFLGPEGELLSNHLPYRLVEKDVKNIEFSEDKKRVLVSTQKTVGIIDFSTESMGNVNFEKGPEYSIIFSSGKAVRDIYWVYDSSHVIFRDESSAFLIGLKEYGAPLTDHLFEIKKGSSLFYSEDLGVLYYIDPDTGNLVSLEILPNGNTVREKDTPENIQEK